MMVGEMNKTMKLIFHFADQSFSNPYQLTVSFIPK